MIFWWHLKNLSVSLFFLPLRCLSIVLVKDEKMCTKNSVLNHLDFSLFNLLLFTPPSTLCINRIITARSIKVSALFICENGHYIYNDHLLLPTTNFFHFIDCSCCQKQHSEKMLPIVASGNGDVSRRFDLIFHLNIWMKVYLIKSILSIVFFIYEIQCHRVSHVMCILYSTAAVTQNNFIFQLWYKQLIRITSIINSTNSSPQKQKTLNTHKHTLTYNIRISIKIKL